MSNESDNKQQELKHLQDALKEGTVSRRSFLDRMKGLGVGFGAAFLLGMKEADAALVDSGVNVKSTNPAIDNIVKDGQPEQALGDPDANMQVAQYLRVYRRGYRRYGRYYRRYRRYYRRYARYYGRYGRYYGRYGRGYGRYGRIYARF
jgi:hypothetical protein